MYIVLVGSLGNSIIFQENKCVLPIGMTCCQDILLPNLAGCQDTLMPNLAGCRDTCSFPSTLLFYYVWVNVLPDYDLIHATVKCRLDGWLNHYPWHHYY